MSSRDDKSAVDYVQRTVRLRPREQGFHLVTREIVEQIPELDDFVVGLAHIFIQHTSASVAVNENVEPEVRADLESHFDRIAPENAPDYTHTYEGPDDMPAHIKAVHIGSSVTVPVTDGRLHLGTWQGIYLCEHRRRAGARRLVVTIHGMRRASSRA